MALEAGTKLGHYEVLSSLGAGGMGEVYRAKDTKLGREVAIKLLLPEVSQDAERLARFEREARVLASLNHNNIATLHGFEQEGDTSFLIMELVEGETLADRIKRGPVPVDEALPLFIQIAEGLEAAHAHGIVHRDLKPANIKVGSASGSSMAAASRTVKILDFGLAKALMPEQTESGDPQLSASPTLTLAATQRGEILGTAAYMSPEQASGEEVDERADIWAFGVCLYEALTGMRLFGGDKMSMVLASVLMQEPDFGLLPDSTPPSLQRLLRRCLEKEAGDRLRHIGDARLELKDAATEPADGLQTEMAEGAARRTSWPLVAAAVAVGAVIAGVAVWSLRPAPARPMVQSVLSARPSEPVVPTPYSRDVAITPDGRTVIYNAEGSLYVRPVDQVEGRMLASTTAAGPFVSPDGEWVGFFEGGSLKKVSILGGPSLTICEAPGVPSAGSWATDGTIFFGSTTGSLYKVASGGGEPTLVAEPEDGSNNFLTWPQWLPDGRSLLYTATRGGFDQSSIMVLDLETGARERLIQGGSSARYLPTGHLVYAVQDGLRAVAFDLDRLEVRSDPVPVNERVMTKGNPSRASFDFADDGSMVYVSGLAAGTQELTWIDRQGREDPLGAPTRNYQYPRIAPDNERIAVTLSDNNQDVWVWSLRRKTLSPLTRDAWVDFYSVWSADSSEIIFASNVAGSQNLYRRAADGTGEAEVLLDSPVDTYPSSLSADGTSLVYRVGLAVGTFDVGLLDLETGETRELLASEFDELNAEISPDGRFLAYQSNESGAFEIYVSPFPEVGARRWPISTAGGTEPLWSPDGTELFYRAGTDFMAVPVETEPDFEAGAPQVLFTGNFVATTGRMYDVSPDGQRFVVVRAAQGNDGETEGPQVVLVQNWFEELKRLVPTD